ncbi:hypothetical protein M9458_016927, partial [Cirrhinus mrigala]
MSEVNAVVNSCASSVVLSVKSIVISSKVDPAVIPVIGCVVVDWSVNPTVDNSGSSVESSSDESFVNAVGLFVTPEDISDVNAVVNSCASSVVLSVKSIVISSKVDPAVIPVDGC